MINNIVSNNIYMPQIIRFMAYRMYKNIFKKGIYTPTKKITMFYLLQA